jgi:uncharacterized protein (TIGR01777 family)
MKPRIILAGGTGFVGQMLTSVLLSKNYQVVILTRQPALRKDGATEVHWDGKTVGDWGAVLNGAEAVVNLAGKTINCRHTPENRRQIIESRVDSVGAIGKATQQCDSPPKVFVQAGGVGLYGDAGDRICDENAPHGNDFLSEVSEKWENAFAQTDAPVARKVLLRLGVVLGRGGGLLEVLGRLTRCFLGGQVGNGRQFISWIHAADLNRMFIWGIERTEVSGAFNATTPVPVANAEFMYELRRALHRPWSPPVPKMAARIGSWLLGTQADLALTSTRAVPKHFLDCGFTFEFPEIRPALENIYKNHESVFQSS